MNIDTLLGGGLTGATVTGGSWIIPMLAATLAYFQYDSQDQESKLIPTAPEDMLPMYDFIVVGGGSAGW